MRPRFRRDYSKLVAANWASVRLIDHSQSRRGELGLSPVAIFEECDACS
jgi:hypothetical protein